MKWLWVLVLMAGCARPSTPQFTEQDYVYDVIGPMFPAASGRCYDLLIGRPFADTEEAPVIRQVGVRERPCR